MGHTDTQLMDIMERDLLMLSQRLMLLRIWSWIQHSWIWLQIIRIPSLWILWKEICDAKPEADAYYGYGLGYSTLGYGYRSYGYPAYGYYGKRSADAEPEADAYYGYCLGYSTLGYGYRSYGYPAYGAYGRVWG